jgi:hypothetical protein
VFGVPRPGVLVVRQHRELGDQPCPIGCRHQLHELYSADRAAHRLRPRLIQGLRDGYLGDFGPCLRHLHDQVVSPTTGTEPVAEPEANPAGVAFTCAFKFSFALIKPIGASGRGRWNAFAHRFAGFGAARR